MDKIKELETKKQELDRKRDELYQKTLKSNDFKIRKEYEECEDKFASVSKELAELKYQEEKKEEIKKEKTPNIQEIDGSTCPACGGKDGNHFECALEI